VRFWILVPGVPLVDLLATGMYLGITER
jgi:hypothetical protein